MWRKPEENKPQSALDALPSIVLSSQRPAAAAPRVSPNAPSCVTQGIKIKGEISGREDLFLDGVFEGKIHITDGSFTVGPKVRVNTEIEAREIIVRGKVIGTLKASERVQVWSTGSVTGDMETRGIVIEEDAVSARQSRCSSERPAAAERCALCRHINPLRPPPRPFLIIGAGLRSISYNSARRVYWSLSSAIHLSKTNWSCGSILVKKIPIPAFG
jgi:cytoskeletal protein CcmA (bactofilin family)